MQQNRIYIHVDPIKGRGVFAGTRFLRGDLIEICPVINISKEDREVIHQTKLHDYYFAWGENNEQAVIALGYGSLYNHSSRPNAQFVNELEDNQIMIECIKDIEVGDEILINYVDKSLGEQIWFKEK